MRLAVVVAIVVANCGAEDARAAPSQQIVALLGDSISLNYADELQTLLGAGYVVINLSVGGAQTSTIRSSQWGPYVRDCGYSVAVVLGGVNDISGSQPISYTQQHLSAIYAEAGRVGRLIALTLTPTPGTGGWVAINAAIPARNDWIREQASALVTVVDAWAAFGGETPDLDLYQVDKVHPDEDGDAVLAAIVAAAIQ